MESILTYIFSFTALLAAVILVNARNPIHSVLYLILVFGSITGLLLTLKIEFLALGFLAVYVGSISVLFLFVVLFIRVKETELNTTALNYMPLNAVILLILGVQISQVLNLTHHLPLPLIKISNWINLIDEVTDIEAIGQVLYLHYPAHFIISGIILLTGLVGAVVLTENARES